MSTPAPTSAEFAAFDARLAEIARPLLASAPAPLRESILYSLLGPGKRVRPRLVLATGGALGLAPEIAERLGAALEMVHAFTLVHDDLPAMDNDDFRRGRPTNHKVYGEAVALLAGDSLLPLAYETLLPLRTELGPDRVFAVFGALFEASGARGVIAGQVAESTLASPAEDPDGVEKLWEIFRLKTGALFRAALAMPALAAGAPNAAALGRLGEAFGVVFQIADDLEDGLDGASAPRHHVSAWMSAEEARAYGRKLLDEAATAAFRGNDELGAALAPFLRELERKLEA